MKNLPKHYIVLIAVGVVVCLAGGGAWYWTGTQLSDALQKKQQLETQQQSIEVRGIFPSQANLDKLTQQSEEITATLEPVVAKLVETSKLLDPIRGSKTEDGMYNGLSGNDWKRSLGEKRDAIIELAKSRNATLPEDFYLGFKRYRALNPAERDTFSLGVQLMALEELTKILLSSGVNEISEIKRVIVEETGAGPTAQGNLKAKLVEGPAQLYSIYPFEIALNTLPSALMDTVNAIAASPYFFIIRFVDVENEKTSVPRRSEVLSQASTDGDKLIITVAGEERVKAVLRVDLLVWDPKPKEQEEGGREK